MKKFFRLMMKDITNDDFSMAEAAFHFGVILALSVTVIVLVSVLNWLVSY